MAWPVFEFLLIHQHWNSYANTQMCHHQGKWSNGQVDNDVVMSSWLSNLNKIKSQSKKPKTLLLIFHHFKELENIVFCAMNPPLLLPIQSISSPIEYISLCNPRAFPIWPTTQPSTGSHLKFVSPLLKLQITNMYTWVVPTSLIAIIIITISIQYVLEIQLGVREDDGSCCWLVPACKVACTQSSRPHLNILSKPVCTFSESNRT